MTKPANDRNSRSIQSVEQCFELLELIVEGKCTTVTSIANRLNRSESTVHYYLKTLESRRYVVSENKNYRIGLRFLGISTHALSRQPLYERVGRDTVRRLVDKLSDETGETAFVGTKEHGRSIVLYSSPTPEGSRFRVAVGSERPLHNTAMGKALLSAYGSDEFFDNDEIHELQRTTSNTITDKRELRRQIESIAETGVGFSDEERQIGERAIAAPVVYRSAGTTTAYAVGIVGSADDIEDPQNSPKPRKFEQNRPQQVKRAAQTLTNKLHLGGGDDD